MLNGQPSFSSFDSLLAQARRGIDLTTVSELKHLLVYGGGHTLTCRKTGLVWDASDTTIGSNNINGNKTLARMTNSYGAAYTTTNMLGSSPPINNKAGAWAALDGSKVWVFQCVGRVLSDQGARLSLGDQNEFVAEYATIGSGFGLSDGTPAGAGEYHTAITTPGAYLNGLRREMNVDDQLSKAANQNKDVSTYAVYTPGSGLRYKSIEIGGNGTSVIEADLDTVGTVLTIPDAAAVFNPCLRFSGYGLYCAFLYQFNSAPADLAVAMSFQAAAAARHGINEPYPGWVT